VSDDRVCVLGEAAVESLLGLDEVIGLVRDAFVALARGEARVFPMVREQLEGSLFGLRSAYWPTSQLLGLKASGYFPANQQFQRPNHQATIMLISPTTGRLRALVDGNQVTRIRTAAAGALGTQILARPEARTVVIVGNGHQAEAQALSHAHVLADRDPLFLLVAPRDDPDRTKAKHFADTLRDHGIAFPETPTLQDALAAAEIVVTATSARAPLVNLDDVRPGVHITAIGSDTPGKREIDPALVRNAQLVVDDREQSRRYGETQGMTLTPGPTVTLGEVIDGRAAGRNTADEITVFDSTGIGLHDVVTAELAYARALERNLGTWISLE
jgi:ornithine cyclodeaminase